MTSGRGLLGVDEHDGVSAVHCVAAAATCYFVDMLLEMLPEIQSSSGSLPTFTSHPFFLLPFILDRLLGFTSNS